MLPDGVDVEAIVKDVADDGVAIENPDLAGLHDGLVAAIANAEAKGVEDLHVIVLARDHFPDTSLRDLATYVGRTEHGTILVMSPAMVSTHSDELSRYVLERGQDALPLYDPVAATNAFVGVVEGTDTDFTGITVSVILVTVVGAVIARKWSALRLRFGPARA